MGTTAILSDRLPVSCDRRPAVAAAAASVWALTLLLFLTVPSPSPAADDLACLRKQGKSFPVKLTPNGMTRLKEAGFLKKTKRKLRKEKKRTRSLAKKVRKLEKRLDDASPEARDSLRIDLERAEDRRRSAKRKLDDFRNVFQLFAECRDGAGSLLFPQVIEVPSFVVAEGELLEAEKDVTIRAQGAIEILGRVVAAPGTNASITLHSLNSDIRIAAGAQLIAGDGAAGEDILLDLFAPRGLLSTSRGQVGGSVELRAPNGSIEMETSARIHIGNGGAGGEIATSDPEVLAKRGAVSPPNRGGDSGRLVLDAPSLTGFFATEKPLRILDDSGLETQVTAWWLGEDPQIEGGEGGGAGVLAFPTSAPTSGGFEAVTITGASGGDGFRVPGAGQAIAFQGAREVISASAGQSVHAVGGAGGSCLGAESDAAMRAVWSVCEGGPGGDVDVRGGPGPDGMRPAEEGGAGGAATAVAGRGGAGVELGSPQGPCGEATATGGLGGDGHGSCDEAVRETGPSGGDGGAAKAYAWVIEAGCDPNLPGTATATGGAGGNGGDGETQPGSAGAGGAATADGDGGSIQTAGPAGESGQACTPVLANDTPVPCAQFSLGRSYLPVDGTNQPDRDNNACVGGVSNFGAITDPDDRRRLAGFVGTELNAPSFPLASDQATSSLPSLTLIQLTGNGDACTCQISSCRWAELSSRDPEDSLFCAENEFCLSHAFDLDCSCAAGSAIPGCSQKFVSTSVDIIESR